MNRKVKTLLVALVVVVSAGFLTAFQFGHGHRGHGDPEKMVARMDAYLDYVLYKIEATPEQKEKIGHIVTQLTEDAIQMHKNWDAERGSLMAGFSRILRIAKGCIARWTRNRRP